MDEAAKSKISIPPSKSFNAKGWFPYDRKRSQNFLRSAIRDRLRSYGSQPLTAA